MDKIIIIGQLLLLKFKMQEDANNWKDEASEDYYNGFMEAIKIIEEFIYKELKHATN